MHLRRLVSCFLICLLVEGLCGLVGAAPVSKKNKPDTDDASTDSTSDISEDTSSEDSPPDSLDTEAGDSLADTDPEAPDTPGDISSDDSINTNSDGLVAVTNTNSNSTLGGFGIMGSMD